MTDRTCTLNHFMQQAKIAIEPLLICRYDIVRRIIWRLKNGNRCAASEIARDTKLNPLDVDRNLKYFLRHGFLSQEDRILLGRRRRFFGLNSTWPVAVEKASALLGLAPAPVERRELTDYMRSTKILKIVFATVGRYATIKVINESTDGASRQTIADRLSVKMGQINYSLRELEWAKVIKGKELQEDGPDSRHHKVYCMAFAQIETIAMALDLLRPDTRP